jgi:H+/Cl- antiporter ClcA
MVTIKTLLFFIILIILVTKFNSFYRNIYDDVFAVSEQYIKSFIKNNSIMLYLYVIVLFYLASKASLFELTNGYYVSHIKQMLSSINNQNDKYSQPKPYINELSIISVIIFSLVTSISGSGLGSEGVMIYLSIILINYLYFTCKKFFNLDNINTELLIYSGFAIGFDATFTSLISTIIFIFEKMFIYHSAILYSYHLIVLLLIILFIHSLLKSRIPILNIGDIHFNYYNISNLLYIVILSIIIGVICFMFFTSFMFLYNSVKRNKYKDFMVVMFGIILACGTLNIL